MLKDLGSNDAQRYNAVIVWVDDCSDVSRSYSYVARLPVTLEVEAGCRDDFPSSARLTAVFCFFFDLRFVAFRLNLSSAAKVLSVLSQPWLWPAS